MTSITQSKKNNNKSKLSTRLKTETNKQHLKPQDLDFIQQIFKKSLKSKSKSKFNQKNNKTKKQITNIMLKSQKHAVSIQSSGGITQRKNRQQKQNDKKYAQKYNKQILSKKKKTRKSNQEGRLKTISNTNEYNTSRSISKQKSKSKNKTRLRINTFRNNDTLKLRKSQCIKSTKLVTQKSQVKDLSYKKCQTKQNQDKKDVILTLIQKKPKKKKTKRVITTFQTQKQQTIKNDQKSTKRQKDNNNVQQNSEQESAPSTFRKKHLRIKTQFSQRKESFFDSNLFNQLNIKYNQSVQQQNFISTKPTKQKFKSDIKDSSDLCTKKLFQSNQSNKNQNQSQKDQNNIINQRFKKSKIVTTIDQQIQTDKIQSKLSTPKNRPNLLNSNIHQSSHSQIKCFKKMQELKWKVILLQLKQMQKEQQKFNDQITKSNKALLQSQRMNHLNNLINQLDSNTRQVLNQAQSIFSSQKSKTKYAFQNPFKVVNALNSGHNSIHSSNSSSKKCLFQNLQIQSLEQKLKKENLNQEFNIIDKKQKQIKKQIEIKDFTKKQTPREFIIFDSSDSLKQEQYLIPSSSDKNLLQQLQNIKPNKSNELNLQLDHSSFNSNNINDSNFPQLSIQRNYSEQLQKELQQYSCADFNKNKQNSKQKTDAQIQMFELDIQNIQNKRLVSLDVVESILTQVCCQFIKNKRILHGFLSSCFHQAKNKQKQQNDNNNNQKQILNQKSVQQYNDYKIQCDKAYSLELLTRLLDFIQTETEIKQQVLTKLNTPFGADYLKTLKWVRQYYNQQQKSQQEQNQQEQQEQNQIERIQQIVQPLQQLNNQEKQLNYDQQFEQQFQNQSQKYIQETTILTQKILSDFQNKNMNQLAHQQYFFNHCVYNCINQIMDSLRPYGITGKPCICAKKLPQPKKYKNFLQIVAKIARNFIQVISVRAGKTNMIQQNRNANNQYDAIENNNIIKKTYQILDKLTIREQQQKWNNFEDYIFQNKFYISEKIIEEIFLDQCMLIFTEFLGE